MKSISLNGKWKLTFFKQGTYECTSPKALSALNLTAIDAEVPGNVELDLSRAGYLPEDLFFGENILLTQEYESYEWWYETVFDTPAEASTRPVSLRFDGVDCFAQYWLNDVYLGESKNMLIPVSFDIGPHLRRNGKNILTVRIRSAVLEAQDTPYTIHSLASGEDGNFDCVHVRKAPHGYGWDIFPRAVSAGIWRGAALEIKDACEISQLFYYVLSCDRTSAQLRFCYELEGGFSSDMRIEITGRCGDSTFTASSPLRFKAGIVDLDISAPHLWWPYGYGEAALYQTSVRVYRGGALAAEKTLAVGVRTVELKRTDSTDGENGCFQFLINGVPVMCKGTNWVPLDAFHSRDAGRLDQALELLRESGCNMVRCWGGGVYEEDRFFDFCDENGVMVWQDFAMACHAYPQTDSFLAAMREEATSVVRRLRNHASLVLWCGDNECDQVIYRVGTDPNQNRITHETLPRVIYENDKNRPYLPSSPYIAPEIVREYGYSRIPEDHTWGPRDYYKSHYYTTFKAHFVSEVGYHGCPSPASIKKFISPSALWPITDNREWNLHSSDQRNRDHRVLLMERQIRQLFGEVPSTLEDFSLASQFSQAEAKKFFIESMRVRKPAAGGVIWWNLLDGWPQMSDAVVDYYFEKKIAFDYIKRAQAPFSIFIAEPEDWHIRVVAANDTLEKVSGSFSITDMDTQACLLSGDFSVDENGIASLGQLPFFYSDKGMLLIEWYIGGKRYFNHYLYGCPAFSFEQYKNWYEKLR